MSKNRDIEVKVITRKKRKNDAMCIIIYLHGSYIRCRNSATEGTDSAGYILATSWTKLSYLSRKSFCHSFGKQ